MQITVIELTANKNASFNTTYPHIKDTTGIRDGMNIHLVIVTGVGNVRPEE